MPSWCVPPVLDPVGLAVPIAARAVYRAFPGSPFPVPSVVATSSLPQAGELK
jgi:hypothetical protein